ncbi:MAG: hypothetical protein M3384_11050 [Acidobacteriota bacterium]|nr:hypothetical protein [Acidobacteriota bacterium]
MLAAEKRLLKHPAPAFSDSFVISPLFVSSDLPPVSCLHFTAPIYVYRKRFSRFPVNSALPDRDKFYEEPKEYVCLFNRQKNIFIAISYKGVWVSFCVRRDFNNAGATADGDYRSGGQRRLWRERYAFAQWQLRRDRPAV